MALAGADGKRAAELLRSSVKYGAATLGTLARDAVKRYLEKKRGPLFTADERKQLAQVMAATHATAELLGRARIRRRLEAAEKHAETFAEATDFACFADKPLRPLSPLRALEWFRSLIPGLYPRARGFDEQQQRRGFTLAVTTEKTLLQKIQDLISRALETGENIRQTPKAIDRLLDDAGVSPANPQYAEMVFRTNMMSAYNRGSHAEMQEPDVAEHFPVWRYVGIRDGRQGMDHEPHFDKYYPNSVSFEEVRGPRAYNCRCVLPGAEVGGEILLASKSFYSGEAIEMVTRQGTRLAVTPNHPILTESGFVAAGQLKQGQRLVTYSRIIQRLVIGDNVQDAPLPIEQVFGALPQHNLLRIAKRWTALDFHGDGHSIQNEIEIVAVNRELLLDVQANAAQGGCETFLCRSDEEEFCLPSRSAIEGSLRLKGRFRDAADFNSSVAQTYHHALSCKTQGFGDRVDGFASAITFPDSRTIDRFISCCATDVNAAFHELSSDCFVLHSGSGCDGIHRFAGFISSDKFFQIGDMLDCFDPTGFASASDCHPFLCQCPSEGDLTDTCLAGQGRHVFSCFVTPYDHVNVGDRFSATELGCFRLPAETDAMTPQSLSDSLPCSAGLPTELVDRNPGLVALDELVNIKRFHYSGPVYDLQTTQGYFTASHHGSASLVVHNCTSIPIFHKEWRQLQEQGATVARFSEDRSWERGQQFLRELFGESWDSFCQEGDNVGKPGPCPEAEAGQRRQGWLAAAKKLPGKALDAARQSVAAKYKKLEARYGRRYALGILAAAAAGLPMPAPGASLITAAPIVAVAELHRKLAPHHFAESFDETEARLLAVPDVPQPNSYACGAASAMAVGRYFGVGPTDLAAWEKMLGTDPDNGTSPQAIVSVLRALGLRVEARGNMTLDDLRTCWTEGSPVICPIQDYGPDSDNDADEDGHYVTIIGVALGFVFVQDSMQDVELEGSNSDAEPGRVMIDQERFLRLWHDKGADGTLYRRFGIIVSR